MSRDTRSQAADQAGEQKRPCTHEDLWKPNLGLGSTSLCLVAGSMLKLRVATKVRESPIKHTPPLLPVQKKRLQLPKTPSCKRRRYQRAPRSLANACQLANRQTRHPASVGIGQTTERQDLSAIQAIQALRAGNPKQHYFRQHLIKTAARRKSVHALLPAPFPAPKPRRWSAALQNFTTYLEAYLREA